MYISYFPYFCSCIILCVCTCVCVGGGDGLPTLCLLSMYIYIYILNFIFIRLLLNVKKEIKKEFNMFPFYYIFIPFMKQWKHKVNAKLQRQYMRSFIGPGLFDRRWLVANDGCNFEGLYAPERKKNIFWIYSMIF